MNEEITYFECDFYKSFYRRFFGVQILAILFIFLLFGVLFSSSINWSKQPLIPTLFAFLLLLLFIVACFFIPYFIHFRGKKIRITDYGINLGKRYFGPYPSMEEISVYGPVRTNNDLLINWSDIESIVFGQSVYVQQRLRDVLIIKTNSNGIFVFTFDEFFNIFLHNVLSSVTSAVEKSGHSQLIKSMDSFPYPKNIIFPLISQKDLKRNIKGVSKGVSLVFKVIFILFLIPIVLFALVAFFGTFSGFLKTIF